MYCFFKNNTLLRYNSYAIQCNHLKHSVFNLNYTIQGFGVCLGVSFFCIFMYNHYNSLVSGHFHHPKRNLACFSGHSHSPSRQSLIYLLSLQICPIWMVYKWSHTTCTFSCLASLVQHNISRFIHVVSRGSILFLFIAK